MREKLFFGHRLWFWMSMYDQPATLTMVEKMRFCAWVIINASRLLLRTFTCANKMITYYTFYANGDILRFVASPLLQITTELPLLQQYFHGFNRKYDNEMQIWYGHNVIIWSIMLVLVCSGFIKETEKDSVALTVLLLWNF